MHNVGPAMFWLIGAMIAVVCALLYACVILKLHEWGIYPLHVITRIAHRPLFELFLIVVMVGGIVQYGATKGTNGNDRASQPGRAPISDVGSSRRDGGAELTRQSGEITNFCFTSISVSSNMATLEVAWPTNLFTEGTILDYFAKPYSFNQVWQWIGCRDVLPGMTNLSVEVDTTNIQGVTNQPAAMFFKVQDRWSCATTMADADADGLPDVYELHNGTNPYLSDYANAPKLTVGSSGTYATLEAAVSNSAPYSILSLAVEDFVLKQPLQMPDHPVMLTGPHNRYATLHSASPIAAVMLDRGQDSRTLFRNLNLVLEAQSSFQAAFWIGGNLPWSGIGASPMFENVRVRAMYPNCLYYGWHYYRDNGDVSSLSNCLMNAAGATAAIGVYAYDGPRVDMAGCAFVNIPTNAASFGTWLKIDTNVSAVASSESAALSWAGCPLSTTYGHAVDTDGDGLSDYEEVYMYDTDPYLSDSDGDGRSDLDEVNVGTDPHDSTSQLRLITAVVVSTDERADMTNYVAWGTSGSGWGTNGMTSCHSRYSTNTFEMLSSGLVYVKAFRDVNRNGRFDADGDILLIEQAPLYDSTSFLSFRFGDVDGDGVTDVDEREEGTDPYDPTSYCFNMSIVEQDIFSTTNALTAQIFFGTNSLVGPVVMSNRVWELDLGHLTTTERERVVVCFWDDANSNGVRETNECCVVQELAVTGHENIITNELSPGRFDMDSDGILDYWEVMNSAAGLSPTNSADAFVDFDSDGLINLHEYWANCNPIVPDGSNTALSVMARSIDDHLSIDPGGRTNKFAVYNSILNTNCWAYLVDTTCASAYNSNNGRRKAGTALSPWHAVLANHYSIGNDNTLDFLAYDGTKISRKIVGGMNVPQSDVYVVIFEEALPTNITPAKLLPGNFPRYIGAGVGLPVLMFDYDENAIVQELVSALNKVQSVRGRKPRSALRQEYYEDVVGGDSGNPIFLIVNRDVILISTISSYVIGGLFGPNYQQHGKAIQDVMDHLSDKNGKPRACIQYYDFSQFQALKE